MEGGTYADAALLQLGLRGVSLLVASGDAGAIAGASPPLSVAKTASALINQSPKLNVSGAGPLGSSRCSNIMVELRMPLPNKFNVSLWSFSAHEGMDRYNRVGRFVIGHLLPKLSQAEFVKVISALYSGGVATSSCTLDATAGVPTVNTVFLKYLASNGLPSWGSNPTKMCMELYYGTGGGTIALEAFCEYYLWSACDCKDMPDATIPYQTLQVHNLTSGLPPGTTMVISPGYAASRVLPAEGPTAKGLGADPAEGSLPVFSPQWPASSPYATSVGGTMATSAASPGCAVVNAAQFTDAAQQTCTAGERACSWGEGSVITTGGGFSRVSARPGWQKQAVTTYLDRADSESLPPPAAFSRLGRGFPDISALGNNYPIYHGGNAAVAAFSGTSASSPVLAGLFTQLNDELAARGQPALGFLNPLL
jgi:hypothetical protein